MAGGLQPAANNIRTHMRQLLVVVVSGPVAGGKSPLARALADRFDGVRFSTRELLMPRLAPGDAPTRAALQRIGAELDAETGGPLGRRPPLAAHL